MMADPLPSGSGHAREPAGVPSLVPFPVPARLEDHFQADFSRRVDCPVGNRFPAVDLADGEEVDLLFVRPELAARPEIATYLRRTVEILRGDDAPASVARLHAIHLFGDDLVVVCRRNGRFSLEDLLGRCGDVLSFEEAVPLLAPIARAVDFLKDRWISPIALRPDEISVVPAGWSATAVAPFPPISPGQPLHIQLDPVRHFPDTCRNQVPGGLAGQVSATVACAAVETGRPPMLSDPRVAFAALIYRLIEGREVPEAVFLTQSAFSPTRRLGVQSNACLQEILARVREPRPSCARILGELCRHEGIDEPTARTPVVAPTPSDYQPALIATPTPSGPAREPAAAIPPPRRARLRLMLGVVASLLGFVLLSGGAIWTVSTVIRHQAEKARNTALRESIENERRKQEEEARAQVRRTAAEEEARKKQNAENLLAVADKFIANLRTQKTESSRMRQDAENLVKALAGLRDLPEFRDRVAQAEKLLALERARLAESQAKQASEGDPPPVRAGTTDDGAGGARGGINLTGKYSGAYQYSTQKEQPEGRFILNLKQDTPATFSGTCNEDYTNFGTPAADGRLWSDIRDGRIWKSAEGLKIRFLKDYRGHPPSRIIYEGIYNPTTRRVVGKWQAEAGMGADGAFSLTFIPGP